jgi:hypothetical protein
LAKISRLLLEAMAESGSHLRLVGSLVEWIALKHFGGESKHILVDSPEHSPMSKPPRIGGCVPDAVAYLPSGGVIIGEAKTALDIENRHTEGQFLRFLRHCRFHPESLFVVAVPWPVEALARNYLKHLKKRDGLGKVQFIVLEKLSG